MKYLVLLTALMSSTAFADGYMKSCGPELSINAATSHGVETYDQDRHAIERYNFADNRTSNRGNSFGITLTMPLGSQECDEIEAKTAYHRAEAERTYQAAVKARLENLQVLIVTCRTEELPICSEIPKMSKAIFDR